MRQKLKRVRPSLSENIQRKKKVVEKHGKTHLKRQQEGFTHFEIMLCKNARISEDVQIILRVFC